MFQQLIKVAEKVQEHQKTLNEYVEQSIKVPNARQGVILCRRIYLTKLFDEFYIITHNFFPYKVQTVQQLFPNDFGTRIEFCKIFQQLLHENHEFSSNLIMSNLQLCGVDNKQNYCFWASEQLCLLHKTPLHSVKVTVWFHRLVFWVRNFSRKTM